MSRRGATLHHARGSFTFLATPGFDAPTAPHPGPLPASGPLAGRGRDPWRIGDAPPDRRAHACAERGGRVRGSERRDVSASIAQPDRFGDEDMLAITKVALVQGIFAQA